MSAKLNLLGGGHTWKSTVPTFKQVSSLNRPFDCYSCIPPNWGSNWSAVDWLCLWKALVRNNFWVPTHLLTFQDFCSLSSPLLSFLSSCMCTVELASFVQWAPDPKTCPAAQDPHPVPAHSRDRPRPNMATQQRRWGIHIQNRYMSESVLCVWFCFCGK